MREGAARWSESGGGDAERGAALGIPTDVGGACRTPSGMRDLQILPGETAGAFDGAGSGLEGRGTRLR